MAEKKKKEPKEIPLRSGRAGKSRKQSKESKQTKPIKMADGEKIPKGVDKVVLSKDAAGESHVIMTISNIGPGSKKSLKDKAPSTKKTADKPAGKRSESKPAAPKATPLSAKKDAEKEAKAKLAGEVYDLMILNHTPEQRKRLPSRESYIQDQLKPVIIGGRNFGIITMKELEDAKAELLQKFSQKKADKTAPKTTPLQPKKAAEKPVAKRSEPKPAAPKNEPIAAKKTASAKKSAADKLLKHSDKDEMNVAGEKPIVINGANAKPKKAPKVLRRVAKTGGYTVWDDIKRNGKTFATEKEAKDYAADLQKKTGKLAPISPTDRQVTHSFKPEAEKQKK